MGHACVGFEMEKATEAFEHFKGNLKTVKDYGDRCGDLYLHTWDDGRRLLMQCEVCGGYVLLQQSEYHGFSDGDNYYDDYFPVCSPEEAAELNRKFDGYAIERNFPGRFLIQDDKKEPHWSKDR